MMQLRLPFAPDLSTAFGLWSILQKMGGGDWEESEDKHKRGKDKPDDVIGFGLLSQIFPKLFFLMKDAYRIRRLNYRDPLRVDCRFQLPSVRCHACGREWEEGLIQYPAFEFEFLTKRSFQLKRIVDVKEFKQIQQQIIAALGRSVVIVPGASFGRMEGKADNSKLNDFVWGCCCVPQISRRARDILANEGVDLSTAECTIRCGRKVLDSHLAIQVEPVAMLTSECLLEANISDCQTCGDYFQNYPAPDMVGVYQLKRSAWPKGPHLVQLNETLEVIPSREFMAAVEKHQLGGIAFEKYGLFV
jgi:hypothetical protein